MRIGHEVTAAERDALAARLGRALRIGERLTEADVALLRDTWEPIPGTEVVVPLGVPVSGRGADMVVTDVDHERGIVTMGSADAHVVPRKKAPQKRRKGER